MTQGDTGILVLRTALPQSHHTWMLLATSRICWQSWSSHGDPRLGGSEELSL